MVPAIADAENSHRMKAKGPILAVVVLATVVGLLVFQNRSATRELPEKRSDLDQLAAVALTDYRGAAVSLADFKDKPLVVNAWAAWCPFCKQELPDFAVLQNEFPGIVVIAIDRAESLDIAQTYTDGLGISDKMIFLMDPGDDFYKNIGGFSMPETVFIDVHGTIVFHKRGPMTLDDMRKAVKKYLQ